MNESLNSGRYYLGDPSLVLSSKIYNGIWGDIYGYRNGKHSLNGYDFTAHATFYGDGIFYDTKKRKYTVESGILALVHIDLIDDIKLCNRYGHIFNFEYKTNFIYDAGCFYIKSNKKFIIINTNNDTNSDILIDPLDDIFEENYVDDNGENIGRTIIGDSDNDSIDAEDAEDTSDETDEVVSNEKYSDVRPKILFFKKK